MLLSRDALPELLREQELLAPVCRCLCSIVCAMLLTVVSRVVWVQRQGLKGNCTERILYRCR
jgi:hypothetical protein